MNRALTIVVVLAFLAGSVPAAATLADGTPADTQPGASFSGVIGVQESEVTSEVASRSLDQRLNAAKTNSSKASVVADRSEQLAGRLAELEAEKVRLKRAHENGSISKGQYQARLAVLSAELRAVERQAIQTTTAADRLPAEALREKGANVSAIRAIAQQANRTGGGAVAEAARTIAGEGVGNGLGNAPNVSQGPPADRGNGADPVSTGNETDRKPTDAGPPEAAGNGTGAPTDPTNNTSAPADSNTTDAPASNASNGSNVNTDDSPASNASNGSDVNTGDAPASNANNGSDVNTDDTPGSNATNERNRNQTRTETGSDTANRSTGSSDGSSGSTDARNSSATKNGTETPTTNERGQNSIDSTPSADWIAGGVDGALSGIGQVFSDVAVRTELRTMLG